MYIQVNLLFKFKLLIVNKVNYLIDSYWLILLV